jgi:cell division septal protein FtsQ
MSVDTPRARPRLKRSIHEFEDAFRAEAAREKARLVELRKDAKRRTRRRQREQSIRRGRARFVLLVASMIATAVLVTVVMLDTLAWLLG